MSPESYKHKVSDKHSILFSDCLIPSFKTSIFSIIWNKDADRWLVPHTRGCWRWWLLMLGNNTWLSPLQAAQQLQGSFWIHCTSNLSPFLPSNWWLSRSIVPNLLRNKTEVIDTLLNPCICLPYWDQGRPALGLYGQNGDCPGWFWFSSKSSSQPTPAIANVWKSTDAPSAVH